MIKKYVNDPADVIEEMLDGFLKANKNKVKRISDRVLCRVDAPVKNKVGIISGGGSGHQPAFIGYIGQGLLDAVAVGDIFAAPGVQVIYEAIKSADNGRGVLCCIGNFSGDVMNFEMAAELAEDDGIDVKMIIINDDVASSPKENMKNRRGIAGEIIVWKVAGAMAEEGYSLQETKELTEEVLFNTRSMGVAHSPCTLPTTGNKSFEIAEDEMEIGVGHHGEPGIERVKMLKADQITTILTNKIVEDLPFKSGDEVVVLINGLGATSYLEMDICYRKVYNLLEEKNIKIYKNYIGEFFTSQEMAGFSITITRVTDDMKQCFDRPCCGVSFIQG